MSAVKTTVLLETPVLGQEHPFLNGTPHHEPTEELGPLPPELWPNIDHIVTEDDEPVDNIGSEKQQRMLAHILFGWAGPGEGRPFAVFANVGLYYSIHEPPLVPDVMVSLDIKLPDDIWLQKKNRTYLLWEHGKPPDLVIEIVSNKVGKEGDLKKTKYAQIGIKYYVIYDPAQRLSKQKLRIYELASTGYRLLKGHWMAGIGLGLTFWQGKFEDITTTWLRWCDQEGNPLSTGDERADQAQQQAELAQQQAELAQQQADQAQQQAELAQQQAEEGRQRAAQAEESRAQERAGRLAAQQQVELLLAQLRALGADPNLPAGSKATTE
ncbi:MAG: Uma2 family endonuclease [Caldilineaceae bacterium]